MKFEDITRLKIDCPKHGKSDTNLLMEGDVICNECHKDFEKYEKQKRRRELDRRRRHRKTIQEPALFIWSIFVSVMFIFCGFVFLVIDNPSIFDRIKLILSVIFLYINISPIIRIWKERKPKFAKGRVSE